MLGHCDNVSWSLVRLRPCQYNGCRQSHLVCPGITLVHDLTEGLTVDGVAAVAGRAEPVVVLQHLRTAQLGLLHQELQVGLVQVGSQGRPTGPSPSLLVSHDLK